VPKSSCRSTRPRPVTDQSGHTWPRGLGRQPRRRTTCREQARQREKIRNPRRNHAGYGGCDALKFWHNKEVALLRCTTRPGACSMGPRHMSRKKAARKYEPRRVEIGKGEQRARIYIKKNPRGRVPLLQLDNGRVPLTRTTRSCPSRQYAFKACRAIRK